MKTLKVGLLLFGLSFAATTLVACDDGAKGGSDDKEDKAEEEEALVLTVPDAKLDDFKLKTSHAEFTFLNGTKSKDGETQYAPIARVYLSDDELEKGAPKGDGVLLYLSIKGKYTDGKEETLPTGTFEPGSDGLTVEIEIRKGGKTTSLRKAKGKVKVEKSTEKKIEGTIDIKEGDVVIKGPFSAKKG